MTIHVFPYIYLYTCSPNKRSCRVPYGVWRRTDDDGRRCLTTDEGRRPFCIVVYGFHKNLIFAVCPAHRWCFPASILMHAVGRVRAQVCQPSCKEALALVASTSLTGGQNVCETVPKMTSYICFFTKGACGGDGVISFMFFIKIMEHHQQYIFPSVRPLGSFFHFLLTCKVIKHVLEIWIVL